VLLQSVRQMPPASICHGRPPQGRSSSRLASHSVCIVRVALPARNRPLSIHAGPQYRVLLLGQLVFPLETSLLVLKDYSPFLSRWFILFIWLASVVWNAPTIDTACLSWFAGLLVIVCGRGSEGGSSGGTEVWLTMLMLWSWSQL
jgi:hypothetical protein